MTLLTLNEIVITRDDFNQDNIRSPVFLFHLALRVKIFAPNAAIAEVAKR